MRPASLSSSGLPRGSTQLRCAGAQHPPARRFGKLDPDAFGAVSLDESSILKSFAGVTKRKLVEAFRHTPYRLAATATPAPNDVMELGNHAEFLGIMTSGEMLTRWFIADQSAMGTYRLKGHAVKGFWRWVASWARCAATPSDLGFSDEGYILPPLSQREHVVAADRSVDTGGALFRMPRSSATDLHRERRLTADARADCMASLVSAEADEIWAVWVDTDYEAEACREALPGIVEVHGQMREEEKAERLVAFSEGQVQRLLTKPKIAGFGLNLQVCARTGFLGMSYSFESYYQALRRFWRFGQDRPVDAHAVVADTELAALATVRAKAADHERMKIEMNRAMAEAMAPDGGLAAYLPAQPLRLPAFLTAGG